MIKYSKIDECECCNGLDVGMSLYIQGCNRHCKGCFNQDTWNFDDGKTFQEESYKHFIQLSQRPYIHRVTFVGGEPFEKRNLLDLYIIIDYLKELKPNIKIWIYTGYTLEELLLEHAFGEDRYNIMGILHLTDVLVDGNFQEDKKDLTYPFAGSTNQRIIDVQKTIKERKVVLLDL